MAIIFENQTKEWRWKYNQLMIAQCQMDRFLSLYGQCLSKEEWKEYINWEELDRQAIQEE